MPALQQADVDKMTDEELEQFLKPAETVGHEIRPPSLGQKVVKMASGGKRPGEIERDDYQGGIGIGGGGGGGRGAGGAMGGIELESPFAAPLAVTTIRDLPIIQTRPDGGVEPHQVDGHFTPMESRVEVREANVSYRRRGREKKG